jgi:hypothetical protein
MITPPPMKKMLWPAAFTFAALAALPLQAQVAFYGLGFQAGTVSAVTDQGVAVGSGPQGGYRWTAATGLSFLSSAPPYAYAGDVTADGKTIIGSLGTTPQTPFRWTAETGVQDLGPTPGHPNTVASAISSDGSTIVVTGYDPDTSVATTYLKTDGGLQSVGHLPGANSTWGRLSNDGTVVSGTSREVSSSGILHSEAYRWTADGGIVGLGFAPGTTSNDAWGMSGDGSTIVGLSLVGTRYQAFRWTQETGVVQLHEANPDEDSAADDATFDGSLIVGHMNFQGSDGDQPFVWTLETGMISLVDALRYQFGLDDELFGWNLGRATTVSDNGRYIGGYGTWFGSAQAWILDRGENPEAFQIPIVPMQPVPEPSTYGAIGAIGLLVLALQRRFAGRASCARAPGYRRVGLWIQENNSASRAGCAATARSSIS